MQRHELVRPIKLARCAVEHVASQVGRLILSTVHGHGHLVTDVAKAIASDDIRCHTFVSTIVFGHGLNLGHEVGDALSSSEILRSLDGVVTDDRSAPSK